MLYVIVIKEGTERYSGIENKTRTRSKEREGRKGEKEDMNDKVEER